ncbi:hypothetical protein ACFL5V_05515 [Fibrobacterota bacterium]
MKYTWRIDNMKGSALLVVLAAITLAGFLAAAIFNQSFRGLHRWDRQKNHLQALYLAESGIAHQLHQEKHSASMPGKIDTLAGGSLPAPENEDSAQSDEEALEFFLSPELPVPEVSSEEEGAYLAISSSAEYKTGSVEIRTRFGRALTDSIFSSALVLSGKHPLEPAAFDRITGNVLARTRQRIPAEHEFALAPKFTVSKLIGSFSSDRDNYYRDELNKQLGKEGGGHGNGYFGSGVLPDFSAVEQVFFPLGDITIENYGGACLEINGPGTFYAHGDIYVKGCISLEDIQLSAGRSIYFEDSVSSRNLLAYAGKDIHVLDRCFLDLQAIAQENIFLEGTSQTAAQSVLLSIGLRKKSGSAPFKAEDRASGKKVKEKVKTQVKAYGIRMRDEATARGLLIAAGANGTVVMNSRDNAIEGMAITRKSAWLSGSIKGLVITQSLRCDDNQERNCLGEAEINRDLMPPQITLPLDFGSQDRSSWDFKLVEWRLVERGVGSGE